MHTCVREARGTLHNIGRCSIHIYFGQRNFGNIKACPVVTSPFYLDLLCPHSLDFARAVPVGVVLPFPASTSSQRAPSWSAGVWLPLWIK